MYEINGSEIKIGKKITFITAKNGFGKTKLSKMIEGGINRRENIKNTLPLAEFDFTGVDKKAIYFSLDELQVSGNKIQFSFLNKVYNEQDAKFAELEKAAKIIAAELYDREIFKDILKFRNKTTSSRVHVGFARIFDAEGIAINIFKKWGVRSIDTIIKFVNDQGLKLQKPLYWNKEWSEIPIGVDKFLYLSSSYFDEFFLDLKVIEPEDIVEEFYSELKVRYSGANFQRTLTGMAIYLLFISRTSGLLDVLHEGDFRNSFNTDLLDLEKSSKNTMLVETMSSNWFKFGLPSSVSINVEGSGIKLSRDISTLSKSEKYRISFNALYSLMSNITDSKIALLLDDPFDSLDEENHTTLIPAIVELSKKIDSILIATHKLDVPVKFSRYVDAKDVESYVVTNDGVFDFSDFSSVELSTLANFDFYNEYPFGHNLLQRLYYEKIEALHLKDIYERALYGGYRVERKLIEASKATPIQKEILRRLEKVAIFKTKRSKLEDDLFSIKNGMAKFSKGNSIEKKHIKRYINENNEKVISYLFKGSRLNLEMKEFMNDFYYGRTLINNFSHFGEFKTMTEILFAEEEKIDKLIDKVDLALESIEKLKTDVKAESSISLGPISDQQDSGFDIFMPEFDDESPLDGHFEGGNYISGDDE